MLFVNCVALYSFFSSPPKGFQPANSFRAHSNHRTKSIIVPKEITFVSGRYIRLHLLQNTLIGSHFRGRAFIIFDYVKVFLGNPKIEGLFHPCAGVYYLSPDAMMTVCPDRSCWPFACGLYASVARCCLPIMLRKCLHNSHMNLGSQSYQIIELAPYCLK